VTVPLLTTAPGGGDIRLAGDGWPTTRITLAVNRYGLAAAIIAIGNVPVGDVEVGVIVSVVVPEPLSVGGLKTG
jgi:hypothetical protein